MDAYDLDVVNAIREGDVPALRRIMHNNNNNNNNSRSGSSSSSFQPGGGNGGKSCMNACNKFGESILSMACRRGHYETVHFLVVEAQVDVHLLRDDFGRRPHHDTCWTASLNDKVMDILLFGGGATATAAAAPPAQAPQAMTMTTTLSPIELLLEKDVRGHTPFHYARREHWDGWVRFLEQRSDKLLNALEVHYQDATTTTAAAAAAAPPT
jgi:ankyrin repeat protein